MREPKVINRNSPNKRIIYARQRELLLEKVCNMGFNGQPRDCDKIHLGDHGSGSTCVMKYVSSERCFYVEKCVAHMLTRSLPLEFPIDQMMVVDPKGESKPSKLYENYNNI